MAASFTGGTRIGPFTARIDEHSALIWRNYAVPDGDATPSVADVQSLVDWFRQHDRVPRLEYVPAAAPAVEPSLVAAGFTVEGRSPVFGCRRGAAAELAAPHGISFAIVDSDNDLLDVVRVQHAAYHGTETPGPADVARLRRLNERGGIVALARDSATGEPVGAGVCDNPLEGVSELAAVGVAGAYQRRGIASALTAFLARFMHEHGAELVWLERELHLPDRLYELAGFRRGAEKLWISLPPPEDGPVATR